MYHTWGPICLGRPIVHFFRCSAQVKRALRHLTEASLVSVLLRNLHRVRLLPSSSLIARAPFAEMNMFYYPCWFSKGIDFTTGHIIFSLLVFKRIHHWKYIYIVSWGLNQMEAKGFFAHHFGVSNLRLSCSVPKCCQVVGIVWVQGRSPIPGSSIQKWVRPPSSFDT